jgi:outer membrane immunogenic protein
LHRTTISAAVAILAFSATASAQDIYLSGASAYNWTGFYVGGHGAVADGTDEVHTAILGGNSPPATNSFALGGVIGGLQAGYNLQIDHFVVGIEGEYTSGGVGGSFNFDTTRPEAIAGGDLEAIFAVKAKAGVALDRTLVYATAGYAASYNNGFANNVWLSGSAVDVATGGELLQGYVIGAGVEHAVTDQLAFKAEYNHYSFGRGDFEMVSDAYPTGVSLRTEPKIDVGVFKVGLNLRF